MGDKLNANFGEKRQNRPTGIRLSGVRPPSTPQKLQNLERTLFWRAEIKTRTLSKNEKIEPHHYIYQPPLY